MILILTEAGDVHADHLAVQLTKRGAEYVRWNTAEFPVSAELSFHWPGSGSVNYALRHEGIELNPSEVQKIWYRRPRPPKAHDMISDKLSQDAIEDECLTFVNDYWNSIQVPWVPASPAVIKRAQFKASQLRLAAELGFEVPPTLITNSPVDFLNFYQQHQGRIVSKMVGFSFFTTIGTEFCRYTEVVSTRDTGYASAVRYCPVIFQEYVRKLFELRVTVVGEKLFAAEIHSQATRHTQHDWRRYDFHRTPYKPHDLPPGIAQRCLSLVQQLGLCYGAIDLVFTPDGQYVFLEINPNGQYLWVEEETGMPITEAVCDLLMQTTNQNLQQETETEQLIQ